MRFVLVALLLSCPAVARADGFVDPVAPSDNADGSAKLWAVDVLLGVPTGVRVQRSFQDDPDWMVEAVVGVDAIFPAFGVGLRKRCSVVTSGCEEFVVSPGVDAYLLLSPSDELFGSAAVPMVVADVDLAWRHHFNLGNCGEIGLKLGLGVGFGERVGVLPQVAVYGGWRF